MTPVYLNEKFLMELSTDATRIVSNGFNYDDFKSWLVRKANGISVAEVDRMAKKVHAIKSHEQKLDVIQEINQALTDNEKKLADIKKSKNQKEIEYVQLNIEGLKALKSKAMEFNVANKPEDATPSHVITIDRNT